MEPNIMQNFFNVLTSRRLITFGAVTAFIFFALISLSAPGQIAYAAGTVTGIVYRDYNADGSKGTREPGLGGITVKAFNAAGAVVQTTTTFPVCVGVNQPVTGCTGVLTPAPGTYTLASMANGPYRIEFTTTNTGLQPGAFGSGNGTTVQFVDVTAGNVTNLNASMNAPRDYCQSNPDLITPCYADGAQGGTDGTLYSHDYTESSPTAPPASLVTESTETQIGSTWGLAYRSTTNTLYAAAYLKRAAGFDQTPALIDRPGQIYSVTPGGAADGATFVVIPNAGGTVATDLHSDFNPSNADADFDSEAFPLVGKRSLGDIELNGDETRLYVVNLNDRHLYDVLLSGPSVTDRGLIPKPADTGCNANGEGRPFGLGWRDDLLYVGGVCTAEGASGTAAMLQAYVYTFNPATNTFSASPVMQFSLNFDRQCLNIGGGTSPGLPVCKGIIERPFAAWRPWRDVYSTIVDINNAGDNDTYSSSSGNGGYPMPMFSDIVFDGDDMILGFRDRNGDMIGHQDPGPTQSQTAPLLNTTGAGDVYRANPNATSGWTVENDSNSVPIGIFGPTAAGAASPQGPGGGEFYVGDNHNNHDETVVGGLAQVPGNSEVAITVIDPDVTGADLLNGGTFQLSNVEDHPSVAGVDNEGARVRNVEIFDYNDDTDRFAKANGLGDLEALCNAAPLEVGNRVWRDTDGDGIQDPGEMPLAGVRVRLFRAGVAVGSALTDSNGTYYFVSSAAADGNTNDNLGQVSEVVSGQTGIARSTAYEVRIEPAQGNNGNLLNGLALTTQNAADAGSGDAGANADARDSDATLTGGNYVIAFTSGGAGNNNHTFDLGFAPLGSIGNRVWVDEDSNGFQDEGEDGIPNVTVQLKNSGGTVIATTITDSQGYYLFPNLAGATYFVQVLGSTIPTGMTQTTIYPNAGADLFNQNQSVGSGYQVILPAGTDNLTADFGYNWNPTGDVNSPPGGVVTAALGDRVWIDTNGNGRQDAGEVGVSGVTVTLTGPGPDLLFSTAGDNTTATTTTNSNGYYIFDGLTPGAYTVTVTSAAGASHAILTAGQYNQTGDPDHWGTTGTNNDNTTTTPIVLGPGDVFLDADFGYQPSGATLGSVGNYVWFDRDGDGVGPTVSGEAQGGAPGTDNTEEGIGGVSVALIRDLNDNGVWDAGEPIIATMYTSDGTQDVDGDGTVDYKGFYRFRSLQIADGTGTDDYLVWVNDTARVLDGLRATYDLDGAALPASGLVTGLGISRVDDLAGAIINHDFGYTPDNSGEQASRTTLSPDANTGTIGNFVWLDIDGDGVGPNGNGNAGNDNTEPGIEGVRVLLYQDSNGNNILDAGEPLIAITYTSPEGYYLFTNLVTTDGTGTDDYIVMVDTTTLPGGLTQTYDATAPTTDSRSVVANLTTTPVLTQDFGYRGTGTVGNLVWNDVNADGNVDAGEAGINGVTLDIYYDQNGNGKIDAGEPKLGTTTTAGGGAYLFSGLPTDDGGGNAQFVVDVTDTAGVLSGYWHSLGVQSQASDNESKTDPFAVTLTPGTPNVLTVDFGYYVLPAALGNYVWRDTNGNGVQDAGEPGINGVTVQLTITYPNGATSSFRTITGDDPNTTGTQLGWYGFDNLLQDEDYNGLNTTGGGEPTFSISVVSADNTGVLLGLGKTLVDQGGNDLLDSDNHAGVAASAFEGQRNVAQQTSGGTESAIASYDFGYTPLGSIGNRVWVDEDSNGYQDEGEDGIPNVIVQLRNSGGTVIATTRTDSQGYYLFPNLSAGTYFVSVQSGIPAGMTQTTVYPNAGSDLYNQDQTTNPNGYQIVLLGAQDNLSGDFGYNWNPTSNVDNGGTTGTTATIGDRVWIDTNGNGRQDAGEVGVSGVTVTLTGPGPDFLFSTAGDNTTATTTTDANGYYIFDGLTPGAYTVTVTAAGAGASHAILTAGQYTQTGDADHWGTTGTNNDNTTTTPVVLGPGDVFLDADFGYQPAAATLGSVGNYVWFDRDADGVGPTVSGEAHGGAPGTDNTEEGIGGVSVSLIRDSNDNGVWDAGEPIIATMYTSDGTQDVDGDGTVDYKGFYRFRSLQIADGTGTDDYLVWVNDTAHVLDGLVATYDLDGSGAPASGLVTGLGISRVDDLAGAVVNHDFGYTPDNSGQQASFTTVGAINTGVIGNYVWLDIDGDGNGPNGNGDGTTVPETGEVGIANVRVNLYLDVDNSGTINAGDVLVGTTLTSPEGYYLFPNLSITDGVGTDDYIVQVDTTTLPGGLTQTYDATAPTTDSTSRVQDLTATPVLTQDFGYRGTGTIGNLVWNDVNADGDQDAGETGIGGVTVTLYYDRDGDGKIDPGEPILGTQTTSNGSQDVDNDGTTDALGFYRFRGLPTDDGGGNAQYIVDVTDTAGVLSGFFHSLGTNPNDTTDTAGGETTAISHNDPVPVTLTTGVPNNRNADFGYYVLPAGVGNFVFNDANANGIQDVGEVGINGVVVQMTITYPGANGVIGGGDDTTTTLRTTTGDNPNQAGTQVGWYSFDNLLQDEDYNNSNAAGQPSFSISVVTADNTGVLAGLVKTNIDQGGSDLLDSDNHAGVTATASEGLRSVDQLSPTSGEANPRASYDFGYTAPVNLGDRVWYDINNDGIFDADGVDNIPGNADDEVGINGVVVELYRDTNGDGDYDIGVDTLIGTQTTAGAGAAAGTYNFTLMTPSITATLSTHYFVVVRETNFTTGGGDDALVGYQNSSTVTDEANSDVNNRDHGRVIGTLGQVSGFVVTQNAAGNNSGAAIVTLAGEPTNDGDGNNGNLTLDFGFYRMQLTGTVFTDNAGTPNGTLDAGETTNPILTGLTVRLYLDANDDDIPDGAAIATTTTTAGGNYTFSNLSPGRYIVGVVLPNGWHSTIDTADQADNDDPVSGTNNNDNGRGNAFGEARSHSFNLQPGSAASNNALNYGTGTTSNDRLDFGMNQSPTAVELGAVNATANADNTVTITWETLNEITMLGFNVQRSDTQNGEFANLNAALIAATTPGAITGNTYEYVDTTAELGATYFYRLQVVRADSTTLESEAIKVTVGEAECKGKTDAPLLATPEDKAKLKAGKIEFSWNAVNCAKKYEIELRADSPEGALIAQEKSKDTTFSIKKLDQGTTYYWRVSACNAKGKCVASEWWSFKIKKEQQ